LHTLRAVIDYGFAEADTQYGKIGVKVWINQGERLEKGLMSQIPEEKPHQGRGDRRDRRDRKDRDGRRDRDQDDNRDGGDRSRPGRASSRRPSIPGTSAQASAATSQQGVASTAGT
jgi:small subunit ribosomal protein S3